MEGIATTSGQLLDRQVPRWQFREVHSRRIDAPSHRVIELVLNLRPRDVPFSTALLALRLAPVALVERKWPIPPDRPWIEILLSLGFVELGRSDHEVVFGAIGRFWRVREQMEPISDSEEFESFDEPGFAKGAMSFRVVEGGRSVTLITETRVWATDDRARRAFRPYWIPVRALGGLMRREMLAAVARSARDIGRGSGSSN